MNSYDPCSGCEYYTNHNNVTIVHDGGRTETSGSFLCTNPYLKSKVKSLKYLIQIDGKRVSNAIRIGDALKICERAK